MNPSPKSPGDELSPDAAKPGWKRLGVEAALVALLYLAGAGVFVHFGEQNSDEGFYAAATQSVLNARVPYRDFAYTQTPLVPYLQAAPAALFQPTVAVLRHWNALLGALAVGGAFSFWRRHGLPSGRAWGFVLVWVGAVPLLYYQTIAKTYAATQLLLVAAVCAALSGLEARRRLGLVAALGSAAIACRLTVAPCVALLWVTLAWSCRGRVRPLWLVAPPVLAGFVWLGPLLLLWPDNARYWIWEYHLGRTAPDLGLRLQTTLDSLRLFPGIAVLTAGTAWLCWRQHHRETPLGLRLAGAAAAGAVLQVFVTGSYAEYLVPMVPAVLAAAGSAATVLRSSRAPVWLALLAIGASFGWRAQPGMTLSSTYLRAGYLADIAAAAKVVRAITPAGESVLAATPEVPLEAGRPILPELVMGPFSATVQMDDREAGARHVMTFWQLRGLLEAGRPATVVLSHFNSLNFSWTIPSLVRIRPENYREFISDPLRRRYACVHVNRHFLVFQARPTELPEIPLSADDFLAATMPEPTGN